MKHPSDPDRRDIAMKVAFLGVGAIGSPMARRLLPHHQLTVFDVNAAQVNQLVALGAAAASTPGEWSGQSPGS